MCKFKDTNLGIKKLDFNVKRGAMAAYLTDGRGTGIRTLSQHEVIKDIAQAHQKSTYQVILRWHLQSGIIAIPGSSNAAHIAEDYDIFDLELTPDDMQRINDLECNHRFASY